MEGWLPDNFKTAGGGLSCVGPVEDGFPYLASNLLDPVAKAQQPDHTDFSPTLLDWDADGVSGTAARMERSHRCLVPRDSLPQPSNTLSQRMGCGRRYGWARIISSNVSLWRRRHLQRLLATGTLACPLNAGGSGGRTDGMGGVPLTLPQLSPRG